MDRSVVLTEREISSSMGRMTTALEERLRRLGLAAPAALLPAPHIDGEKWAAIACDQFTQDESYWEEADRFVGDAPSTLRLVFPEIFLEREGKQERIDRIHSAMRSYLAGGVFTPQKKCFYYIERTTPETEKLRTPARRGVIACIDLERYDWKHPERALIRATEDTVPERLPPRMDIRRGAPLEVPHILLLINDPEDFCIRALEERAKGRRAAYKTRLMFGAGSVAGWIMDREEDAASFVDALERLADKMPQSADGTPFLFAVGDGNHSLASAKAVWEEYKTAGVKGNEDHPARYAMVEIENLYDLAVRFEPIHRVLFGQGLDELVRVLSALPDAALTRVYSADELARRTAVISDKNRLGIITESGFTLIEFGGAELAVAQIQSLLDNFVQKHGCAIDYVHGADAAIKAAAREKSKGAAILLPPLRKSGFFETVSQLGSLPRKSFSMGEAHEKRFYFECRELAAKL